MTYRFWQIASFVCTSACSASSYPPSTSQPELSGAANTSRSTPSPSQDPQNPWSDCYVGFEPTGNPTRDLERLTSSCGKIGGMRALTVVTKGQQKAVEPADRFTFYVPRSGQCYRIFAASERSVADLDLLLRGPDGSDVIGDLTHDSWPVLPPRAPLCFTTPGLYLLEVSVVSGEGHYALQVWGR